MKRKLFAIATTVLSLLLAGGAARAWM